ncbi:hypothetical protein CHS0354_020397 [Potamilus streckersoni]|uniref:Patched domain-containing protein n=1 Tax=Potamilus streckersoni TaxID=2493646 RepID=A0AAE0TFV7_9BIVA|nr:hypothetical protein CHS0354_020397 [Potamilus streckersoni]
MSKTTRGKQLLESFYTIYGKKVAAHPWKCILLSIVVNGVLGLGIYFRLTLNNDVQYLYIPENTMSLIHRAKIDSTFSDESGNNFWPHTMSHPLRYGEVILFPKHGSNIFEDGVFENISTVIDTVLNISLSDDGLSYRNMCAIRNEECVIEGIELTTLPFQKSVQSGVVNYTTCNVPACSSRYMTFLGDIIVENETLLSARYIKLRFNLRQSTSYELQRARRWQDAFVNTLKTFKSDILGIAFSSADSTDEEISNESIFDTPFFGLCFTVLITYSNFVTGSGDCVSKRVHLSRAGFLVVPLSVLGSWGLLSWCGVLFTNIIGCMPYVLLALTLGFVFINHMTFFAACLALHEKRVSLNRHCCTCLPVESPDKLKEKGRSRCFICCCSGKEPSSSEELEGNCQTVPRTIISRFALYLPLKTVSGLLYLGYLSVSIWGATKVKFDMLDSKMISPHSYSFLYNKISLEHFDKREYVMFFIDSYVNHSDLVTLQKVSDIISTMKTSNVIDDNFAVNWLDAYGLHKNSSNQQSLITLNQFIEQYQEYKNDVHYSKYGNDNIMASRIYVRTVNLKTSVQAISLYMEIKQLNKMNILPGFAYCSFSNRIESATELQSNMLRPLITAIIALALTSFFLIPQPIICLIVIWTAFSIMLGTFGFLWFWDISLTTISILYVMLTTAYAVEVAVHCCSAFYYVEAIDNQSRVYSSLTRANSPIFTMLFGSTLGLPILLLVRSYVFSTFFKVAILTLAFSAAHTIFFLPMMLSIFGLHIKAPKLPKIVETFTLSTTGTFNDTKHPIISDFTNSRNCDNKFGIVNSAFQEITTL